MPKHREHFKEKLPLPEYAVKPATRRINIQELINRYKQRTENQKAPQAAKCETMQKVGYETQNGTQPSEFNV